MCHSELQCEVCVCVFETQKAERPSGDLMESGPQLIFSELFGILWKECVDGLHCWLLQRLSNEAPLCLHPDLIHAGMTISLQNENEAPGNQMTCLFVTAARTDM